MNEYAIKTNQEGDISPKELISYLPSYDSNFETTFKDYSHLRVEKGQEAKILEAFDEDIFNERTDEPYRYGSYFIYEANNKSK